MNAKKVTAFLYGAPLEPHPGSGQAVTISDIAAGEAGARRTWLRGRCERSRAGQRTTLSQTMQAERTAQEKKARCRNQGDLLKKARKFMPRGNGTRPMGIPRTDRGLGFCAGYATAGCANPAPGMGFFGRGRGRRNCFRATGVPGWIRRGGTPLAAAPEAEQRILENQATQLQAQLDAIKARLDAIRGATSGK